jgi:hypothetical protein
MTIEFDIILLIFNLFKRIHIVIELLIVAKLIVVIGWKDDNAVKYVMYLRVIA